MGLKGQHPQNVIHVILALHTFTPSQSTIAKGVAIIHRYEPCSYTMMIYDSYRHLCKTLLYHLKNISELRPSLSLLDVEKLVFISSRLDQCSALFTGIPGRSIQKPQYMPNSTARILMRVRKHKLATPKSCLLHLLQPSAAQTPKSLKKDLKTFLFRKAFSF